MNQLDTIDRGVTDYQKAGRQIFCLHVSDLAALVAVARAAAEFKRLHDQKFPDCPVYQWVNAYEDMGKALAVVLEETGPRQELARHD